MIGAGVFGGYHAAKWASFPDVSLTAIHDPDLGRACDLAAKHGAIAQAEAERFFAEVDIVSIASPAGTHAAWALAALKAGKAVYVEKPLATEPGDADAIVAEARKRGLVAACGFLERAAFQAIGLLAAPQAPLRMEATRMGQASMRNLDVSVVLDLMIHDLDLALAIGAGQPFAVEAEGGWGGGETLEWADAEVTFDDGFTASFKSSRAAEAAQRTLRIVYPSGEVLIDLLGGTLANTTSFALDAGFAATAAGRDRLGESLRAFQMAVLGETDRPLADAADGARALDLALAVQQAAGG